MRRTQIWCDHANCGRFIQDKRTGQGSEHPATIDNADKSWEVWAPKEEVDRVYCSLDCLVADTAELLHIQQKLNSFGTVSDGVTPV